MKPPIYLIYAEYTKPFIQRGFWCYNGALVCRRWPVGEFRSSGGFWTKRLKQAKAVAKRLPKGAVIEIIRVEQWPKKRYIIGQYQRNQTGWVKHEY